MRPRLFGLSGLLCLCVALSSGPALAQSLGEMAVGTGVVGAGTGYVAKTRNKINVEATKSRLRDMGYQEVTEDPDNANQYLVKEPNGSLFKVVVDPQTNNILSAIPQ